MFTKCELVFILTALWAVSIVGCHRDTRTYTVANISITYADENGETYSQTSSGKYGDGYISSSRGIAVHVKGVKRSQGHTGCSWPLLSSAHPHQPLPKEPWIAVISRGACNFEVKVANAWRANASAVIIYNDRDSAPLEKMVLTTDNGRNISAIFTYKSTGEEIARMVDNGYRVMIDIIKGRTSTNDMMK